MEAIIQEILNSVKDKMKSEGAYTHAAYREYVEETIEEFQEAGRITDDENVEFIEDRLMDLWSQVSDGLTYEA